MSEVEDDFFEMANLFPADTGLPMVVWASERGHARHEVRIKVNQSHGTRMLPGNLAVVAVRPAPRLVAGNLSPADLNAVSDWIRLNEATLLDYWEYRISTAQFIHSCVGCRQAERVLSGQAADRSAPGLGYDAKRPLFRMIGRYPGLELPNSRIGNCTSADSARSSADLPSAIRWVPAAMRQRAALASNRASSRGSPSRSHASFRRASTPRLQSRLAASACHPDGIERLIAL